VSQKIAASVEAMGGDVAGEGEFVDLEIGEVGIADDLEGIVSGSEETGILAGKDDDVVHDVREGDVHGDGGFGREERMEGGTEAGEVDEGVVGEEFEIAFDGSPAAEGLDDGGVVVGHRMMNAADDRHAIHPAGGQGEEFAEVNAGD